MLPAFTGQLRRIWDCGQPIHRGNMHWKGRRAVRSGACRFGSDIWTKKQEINVYMAICMVREFDIEFSLYSYIGWVGCNLALNYWLISLMILSFGKKKECEWLVRRPCCWQATHPGLTPFLTPMVSHKPPQWGAAALYLKKVSRRYNLMVVWSSLIKLSMKAVNSLSIHHITHTNQLYHKISRGDLNAKFEDYRPFAPQDIFIKRKICLPWTI
jgi:hypothetical protein